MRGCVAETVSPQTIQGIGNVPPIHGVKWGASRTAARLTSVRALLYNASLRRFLAAITAGDYLMSSSSTRFRTQAAVLPVVAIVLLLAVGAVAGTTADKSADPANPSPTTQTDKASQAKKATQPDEAAPANDSTQSKKSAEVGEEARRASEEKPE